MVKKKKPDLNPIEPMSEDEGRHILDLNPWIDTVYRRLLADHPDDPGIAGRYLRQAANLGKPGLHVIKRPCEMTPDELRAYNTERQRKLRARKQNGQFSKNLA